LLISKTIPKSAQDFESFFVILKPALHFYRI